MRVYESRCRRTTTGTGHDDAATAVAAFVSSTVSIAVAPAIVSSRCARAVDEWIGVAVDGGHAEVDIEVVVRVVVYDAGGRALFVHGAPPFPGRHPAAHSGEVKVCTSAAAHVCDHAAVDYAGPLEELDVGHAAVPWLDMAGTLPGAKSHVVLPVGVHDEHGGTAHL